MADSEERLRAAICDDDLEIVKALIENDPDLLKAVIHPGPNREYRPLTQAAVEGRIEVLEFLIASGCDVNEDSNYPMFRCALHERSIPSMEALVRHGADVNGVWADYGPPIIASCEAGCLPAMDWLLANNAKHTGQGRGRKKKVEWCTFAYLGHFENRHPLMDLLLDHGAKIDAVDANGHTALWIAARRGDLEQVEYLLGKGADPKRGDNRGKTAIQVAKNAKVKQCLQKSM